MITEKKYGLGIYNKIESKERNFSHPIIKIENEKNAIIERKTKELTITATTKNTEPIIITKTLLENSKSAIRIKAKKDSSISVYIELLGKPQNAEETITIEAEENSEINYYELNLLEKNTELIIKKTGRTEKKAKINILSCDLGAKKIFSETKITLEGEESCTKIINLHHTEDGQFYDIKQEAEHANKSTVSDLKAKGALSNSTTLIRGLIKINENAEKSNGYQKSDALLLQNSRIVSIPDLLIHNEDVKCSHGSTISRIDKEKIFYMMSRGLSKEEAEKQAISGFYEPIIAEVKNHELIPRILGTVLEKVKS